MKVDVSKLNLKERERIFIDRLEEKYGDKWEYIEGYKNVGTNLKIRCKKCGEINEYKPYAVNYYKKLLCNYCEKDKDEYSVRMNKRYKDRVENFEENNNIFEYVKFEKGYMTGENRILIKCKKCGSVYWYTHYHVMANTLKICCNSENVKRNYDTFAEKVARDMMLNYSYKCGLSFDEFVKEELVFVLNGRHGLKFDGDILSEKILDKIDEIKRNGY